MQLEPAPSGGAISEVPAGVRRGSRFFREIQSLRGVAILLVMLYHVTGFIDGTRGQRLGVYVSPLRAFAHAGHTGVSLFFILSAFLLSQPFLREALGGERVSRTSYFRRRALRILPLYWAAVFVASLLGVRRFTDLLRGIPYLVFLNSIAGVAPALAPYNSVWWSLATEVQFYLLLPWLPSLVRSRRGRWFGCAAVLAYAAAYVAFVYGVLHARSAEGQILLGVSFFGRAPLFGIGIALAWIYVRYGQRIQAVWSHAAWRHAGDLLLWTTLLGLGLLLRQVAFTGYWETEFGHHTWHLLEGGLWGGVVALLLLAPLRTKAILCNRPLATIGTLSYSLYLVHVPLLYLLSARVRFAEPGRFSGWHAADIGLVVCFLVLCGGVSTLTYVFIERPFLVRKGRIE